MFVAHLMLPNPGPQLMELDWKYVKYVSISYVWLHESHVDNTRYGKRETLIRMLTQIHNGEVKDNGRSQDIQRMGRSYLH